jgi:uncharacterized protein YegP (UPF0339 family)
MAGKFEIRKNASGAFHFSLKAANGERILSGETYESRAGVQNGIESVKKNAVDDSRYARKNSANAEWHFTLLSTNGEAIGTSETYPTMAALEKGIESVKTNAPSAEIVDATNS